MKPALALALALITHASAAHAADRFPMLAPGELSPEQSKLAQALLAGPRGGGARLGSEPDRVAARHSCADLMVLSSSGSDPEFEVGEVIRFNTSLPLRLNELAILITARHWSSQYEWSAHLPLALKAGLDPKIAAELALNKRPAGMKADEAAVYDFCTQLHRAKKVSDAAYKRAAALFGEKGVMDLIGVSGYYTAVSMTLNVAEVPVPAGQKNPLKAMK